MTWEVKLCDVEIKPLIECWRAYMGWARYTYTRWFLLHSMIVDSQNVQFCWKWHKLYNFQYFHHGMTQGVWGRREGRERVVCCWALILFHTAGIHFLVFVLSLEDICSQWRTLLPEGFLFTVNILIKWRSARDALRLNDVFQLKQPFRWSCHCCVLWRCHASISDCPSPAPFAEPSV